MGQFLVLGVRDVYRRGPGTYDTLEPSQRDDRDQEIGDSTVDCIRPSGFAKRGHT